MRILRPSLQQQTLSDVYSYDMYLKQISSESREDPGKTVTSDPTHRHRRHLHHQYQRYKKIRYSIERMSTRTETKG